MKKFLVFSIAAILSLKVAAQTNLQVMYDFGSDRNQVTTTFEMFKPDKWGDTFFFIDHEFGDNDNGDGTVSRDFPSGTYFEIARGLNFWQNTKLAPLSLHVEYNGGVYRGFGVNNTWLFGLNWFVHSKDFKNTLTLEVLYKTIKAKEQAVPMQFTIVWGMKDIFGVKRLNFSGFADFWWEDHVAGPKFDMLKRSTFISEPQLWYQIGDLFGCPNLNIGGEVELSGNFGTYDGFKCNPCLGAKWDF